MGCRTTELRESDCKLPTTRSSIPRSQGISTRRDRAPKACVGVSSWRLQRTTVPWAPPTAQFGPRARRKTSPSTATSAASRRNEHSPAMSDTWRSSRRRPPRGPLGGRQLRTVPSNDRSSHQSPNSSTTSLHFRERALHIRRGRRSGARAASDRTRRRRRNAASRQARRLRSRHRAPGQLPGVLSHSGDGTPRRRFDAIDVRQGSLSCVRREKKTAAWLSGSGCGSRE